MVTKLALSLLPGDCEFQDIPLSQFFFSTSWHLSRKKQRRLREILQWGWQCRACETTMEGTMWL